ncbi:hypothetical protein EDD76_1254 [Kineothrix alysoides]|uniref:Uncharacterized protein n=1 Tax=Kineothrix alysoides TaxID=1469948 RepID=A0A4R1QUI6_9FIRM|nr:hypothetical protein [Kineothrix alysoides]TCL53810.1 hypothetical protein EDD76_1254 [Kineothrix alysoides]
MMLFCCGHTFADEAKLGEVKGTVAEISEQMRIGENSRRWKMQGRKQTRIMKHFICRFFHAIRDYILMMFRMKFNREFIVLLRFTGE